MIPGVRREHIGRRSFFKSGQNDVKMVVVSGLISMGWMNFQVHNEFAWENIPRCLSKIEIYILESKGNNL